MGTKIKNIKDLLDVYSKDIVIKDWYTIREFVKIFGESFDITFKESENIFTEERLSEDEYINLKTLEGDYIYNFRGYGLQLGGFDGAGAKSQFFYGMIESSKYLLNKEEFSEIYNLAIFSLLTGSSGLANNYISKDDQLYVDKLISETIDTGFRLGDGSVVSIEDRLKINIDCNKISTESIYCYSNKELVTLTSSIEYFSNKIVYKLNNLTIELPTYFVIFKSSQLNDIIGTLLEKIVHIKFKKNHSVFDIKQPNKKFF